MFKPGQLWITKDYRLFYNGIEEGTVLEVVHLQNSNEEAEETAEVEDREGNRFVITESDVWDGSVVEMAIEPGTRAKTKNGTDVWLFLNNPNEKRGVTKTWLTGVIFHEGLYKQVVFSRFGTIVSLYFDFKDEGFHLDFRTLNTSSQFEEETTSMKNDDAKCVVRQCCQEEEEPMNTNDNNLMKYSFSSDGILFIAEAEGSDAVRRCNKVHETFDNLHDWLRMMKAAGAEISVR